MKESFPVKVAEHAVLSCISQEPAFAWWVTFVTKKRNQIIVNTKYNYWTRIQKFGITVPCDPVKAKKFKDENGETLWWDAILQKMNNVRPAFEAYEGNKEDLPPGYQQIK